MFKIKKAALAVLALTNSVGFAGTMGSMCLEGKVSVPCKQTAWEFGMQALYLKPAYNGTLGYAAANRSNDPVFNALDSIPVENAPEWTWGFKLEGAYHFNTGNDINLNWYHLGDKTKTYTSDFPLNIPISDQQGITGLQNTAIKPQWDAINLEMGQHVDFGDFKIIRFHGGLQYTHIKTSIGRSGNAILINQETFEDVPAVYQSLELASFKGLGPRIGADLSYAFDQSLRIYANGATALLIGKTKANRNYSDSSGLEPVIPAITRADAYHMVPELEAKIGVAYTRAMANGMWSLDAGCMFINYFDAQQSLGNLPVDSNFSVYGPYMGLKWVGNAV